MLTSRHVFALATLLWGPSALAKPNAGPEPAPSAEATAELGSTTTSPAVETADASEAPPSAPGETPAASDGTSAATNANPGGDAGGDAYAEAKQRVLRGESLFDEGNYDAALAEFERAHQTMEGHPSRFLVLFNIGQCYEKLYRYDGAIDAYRGYLASGGESAEDAPTVRAKMDLLATLLGRLEIDVLTTDKKPVPEYELWVDGRFIGKNKTQALLPGGNHEVEIRASGFEYKKLPLQLPATAARALRFELEPLAEEYRGLRPALFWTTTALAIGTAVTGGIFGTLALGERNSLEDQKALGPPESLRAGCGNVPCDDQNKRIENLATTADIFFVASGVFTVTAVVLGFMTDFSGQPEKKTATRPTFDVHASPGGGRLTLEGAF